eukprot:903915-Rhodomonas_salina.1
MVLASRMTVNQTYVVSFNLTNPRGEVESPPVSVGGTVEGGSFDADVVTREMTKVNEYRLGVGNGSQPLK